MSFDKPLGISVENHPADVRYEVSVQDDKVVIKTRSVKK